MRSFKRQLAVIGVLVVGIAGAAIPAAAHDSGGFSGQGLPADSVLVDTSLGLPVSVEISGGESAGDLQMRAEERAAYVTRDLEEADIAVLHGDGPRIMTWDVDADAITSVRYRNEPAITPFYLAPGLGCTDSGINKSCIIRSSGSNRSLTGTNDVTNPSWSSTNSTLFAGPRNIQSEVCAGSGPGNCQGLPADYYMEFPGSGETIYRVKHF